MLDHVSITVSDLAVAERFYDAVLAALGVAKVGSNRSLDRLWRAQRRGAIRSAATCRSARPRPEDAPRRHWCFKAPDRAAVDAFWRAGLAQGGRDNGAPGLRPEYHPSYYAAFLLDPDGNRIEAVCHN